MCRVEVIFLKRPRHLGSTLFPYTTLFRSGVPVAALYAGDGYFAIAQHSTALHVAAWRDVQRDRKSTRLNSSHANISYAVFCLKKKHLNTMIELDSGTSAVHVYTRN